MNTVRTPAASRARKPAGFTAPRWALATACVTVALLAAGGVYVVVSRMAAIIGALQTGSLPPADSFEGPFARRPGLAFLHLLPALVFVVLGPLQLTRPP